MTTDLILGTAGHIDHGKTSLIVALTGVDTDRLPEEKQRGITIDLGFAELCLGDFRLGIVDVPGHERFVRNMLAGATGMDLAMLVVAADDSVKPQTREHLDILRLLDLRAGVIAITKCDLVDSEWIDLVEQEVGELVAGTFLAGASYVRTSATTGQGIAELRAELETASQQAIKARPRSPQGAPFRMPIDRTFTISGHGTVVTGSVSSGQLHVGDELVIQPGALHVRVRGLQNHDRTTDQVHRGQRAAVNLGGIHYLQIKRGHELASAGHLCPSRLLTVQLQMVDSAPRPLKQRSRVRVHVGTAQLLATVVLLDLDQVKPGQQALAQLFLAEPAVTTWKQPFVIRSESPVQTIGGGQVLVPNPEKLARNDTLALGYLRDLTLDDPVSRASASLFFAGLRNWHPEDLARTAGIDDPSEVTAQLAEQGLLCEVRLSPTRTQVLHRDVLQQLCLRVEQVLETLHQRHPLRTSIDRQMVTQAFRYLDEAMLNHALATLRETGQIRTTDRGVALKGHGPKLSQNERKLLASLVETYRQAGMAAPTVKQVQQQTTKNQGSVPQLIALAEANGDLIAITPEYYLHTDVDRDLRATLSAQLSNSPGLTLSQIRELLKTTRKYAVPYCEYLDRIGFTERQGDLRTLAAQDK